MSITVFWPTNLMCGLKMLWALTSSDTFSVVNIISTKTVKEVARFSKTYRHTKLGNYFNP